MTESANTRSERLQVRLDANSKDVLQRAARYQHKTVSQFVLSTALEEAAKVIREKEVVTLTDLDWTRFLDALINPPEPNPALNRAFDRYRQNSRWALHAPRGASWRWTARRMTVRNFPAEYRPLIAISENRRRRT